MSSPTISAVHDNERMDPTHPRADGPRRRRVFTTAEKLAHLVAYEQACEAGDGGAYLLSSDGYRLPRAELAGPGL